MTELSPEGGEEGRLFGGFDPFSFRDGAHVRGELSDGFDETKAPVAVGQLVREGLVELGDVDWKAPQIRK